MPLVARLGRSEVVVVAPHERGKHHRHRVGAWQRRRSRRFGRAARGRFSASLFFVCFLSSSARVAAGATFASRRAACRRRGSPAGQRVALGALASRAGAPRRGDASPRAWHHGARGTCSRRCLSFSRVFFSLRFSRAFRGFAGRFITAARSARRRAAGLFFFSAFFRPARVSDLAEDLATACSEPGAGFRAGSGAGRVARARRDRARFARDDGLGARDGRRGVFFLKDGRGARSELELGKRREDAGKRAREETPVALLRDSSRVGPFGDSGGGVGGRGGGGGSALGLHDAGLKKRMLPDEFGKARRGVTNASRSDCSSVSDNEDASRNSNERRSRLGSTENARGRAVASGRVAIGEDETHDYERPRRESRHVFLFRLAALLAPRPSVPNLECLVIAHFFTSD